MVAAVLVPRDHRDRVGLDDQVGGQSPRLIGSGERRGLIWVTDSDQISHGRPFLQLTFGASKRHARAGASPGKEDLPPD